MNLERIALFVLLPVFLLGAVVGSSEYKRMHAQYNRSDGVYQRTDSDGFDWMINGVHMGSVGKTVYEDFTNYGDGDSWCMQSDGTACSGTAGEINYVTFPSGNKLSCISLGTQTILGALDMDAGSLDISGDQTDNDGVDCAWGLGRASGGTFTVGTDGAFFTCMQVSIADASGTDDFWFGFRQADDIWNQTFDNYTDLAAIGLAANANPNNLTITTIANNASNTDTDTTINWDDGDRFDLCVFVSAAGVATFYYDDASSASNSFSDLKVCPTTQAYTFTDAESLVPFFHLVQHGDLTEEVDVYEWVTGFGTFPLTDTE